MYFIILFLQLTTGEATFRVSPAYDNGEDCDFAAREVVTAVKALEGVKLVAGQCVEIAIRPKEREI